MKTRIEKIKALFRKKLDKANQSIEARDLIANQTNYTQFSPIGEFKAKRVASAQFDPKKTCKETESDLYIHY